MHELGGGECSGYTAFAGDKLLCNGTKQSVASEIKALTDDDLKSVLIFDDSTGQQIDFDLRDFAPDKPDSITSATYSGQKSDSGRGENSLEKPSKGPGRPKLGVVSREVTLLPRHWDWLNAQSGGASVALRKLVDAARRDNKDLDRARRAKESCYKFLSAMAGNNPGYEEAMRALFAGARERFDELIGTWPVDVQSYARKLGAEAFTLTSESSSSS